MSLATFGAILTHALALEKAAADFYQEPAQAAMDELAGTLAGASRKRLERLERLRREGVAEMILEPIHGFEEAEYPVPSGGEAARPWRERAGAVEDVRQRFFSAAAAKMPIREVSRQFERLAKENADFLTRLGAPPAGS